MEILGVTLIFLAVPVFIDAGFMDIAQSFSTIPKKFSELEISEADYTAFMNFKMTFDRNYASESAEISSLLAFTNNLRIINIQNHKYARGKSGYQDSVNNLTDIEHDNFILTHTGYIGTVSARVIRDVEFPNRKIPKYLNYNEEGLVSKVMYQGYCGACWAFSAVGTLEAQLAKKYGKLVKLSEQDLIDCNKDEEVGNWGCNGGNMQNAYKAIKAKGGISPYISYQYKGKGNYSCKFDRKKSVGTVKDYVELERGNETQLLLALAHVGPISVAIDASEPSFQHYKGGIYDNPDCSTQPNHAVLLVGYGTDPEQGPYWILKNSWGSTWGENGFFRLPRDHENRCGIAVDATYPIV